MFLMVMTLSGWEIHWFQVRFAVYGTALLYGAVCFRIGSNGGGVSLSPEESGTDQYTTVIDLDR